MADSSAQAEPIDVVYTWVDGAAPGYQELLQSYSKVPRDLNPERYRDAFTLLRYSLRSLERFAPWFRNVYIFTCRPQVPGWLKRDHPRLRIVHHDEVMPGDGTLPAFNSNVIETFLPLLPGISRRILYLNDDYLFGRPVSWADFFTPDGRLRVFGTLVGEHFRARIYEHQVFSFGLVEHGPILIDCQLWAQAMATAATELAAQRLRRFRLPEDVRPERLYRWYLLTHCRSQAVAEPCWRYLAKSSFHKIRAGVAAQRRGLTRIRRRRPAFFCLNDDLRDRPDPEVVACVAAFLADYYPEASSFESTP
jgi:hypothetical protein